MNSIGESNPLENKRIEMVNKNEKLAVNFNAINYK